MIFKQQVLLKNINPKIDNMNMLNPEPKIIEIKAEFNNKVWQMSNSARLLAYMLESCLVW